MNPLVPHIAQLRRGDCDANAATTRLIRAAGMMAMLLALTVSGSQNPSSLRGSINHGGPRLLLRTSGGDIRLTKI